MISHAGHESDLELIENGVRPDIIIGGHTQEKIFKTVSGVKLVQAGMDGEMIGHLLIERKGNLISIENEFMLIKKMSPIDSEARQLINALLSQ